MLHLILSCHLTGTPPLGVGILGICSYVFIIPPQAVGYLVGSFAKGKPKGEPRPDRTTDLWDSLSSCANSNGADVDICRPRSIGADVDICRPHKLYTKQQYPSLQSHSRESGNPGKSMGYWMPVFTGMTTLTRPEYDERLFQHMDTPPLGVGILGICSYVFIVTPQAMGFR